jgi:exosortase O
MGGVKMGCRALEHSCEGETGRGQTMAKVVLLAAWCVASLPSLRWMHTALSQPAHVVQLGVLLCLTGLGLYALFVGAQSREAHPRALPIALSGVACASIARMATDIQFIHAAGSLLLLYALSAMFIGAHAWRRRLVVLTIVLLCLPIQPHVDAHLGLPLRLWTAQIVAPILQLLGVENVTVESVIVTENSVADIASACSGVRTLWYAVALWLCGRVAWPDTPRSRWWLAGLLSVLVATGFNALRVTLLILALHHHAPPLLADMAHASLGLLALVVVGAINFVLCRHAYGVPHRGDESTTQTLPSPPTIPTRWLVATMVLGMALLPLPLSSRSGTDAERLRPLSWPAEFRMQTVPLSAAELGLVAGRRTTVAEKNRFSRRGVSGSMIIVESGNWRAQHAPELCLIAQGARIENVVRTATPDGEFRLVTMQAGTQVAMTWFQSGSRIEPDLSARLWAQFIHPQQQWSLVTLVVEGQISTQAALDLHRSMHSVVATSHQENL